MRQGQEPTETPVGGCVPAVEPNIITLETRRTHHAPSVSGEGTARRLERKPSSALTTPRADWRGPWWPTRALASAAGAAPLPGLGPPNRGARRNASTDYQILVVVRCSRPAGT